MQSILSRKMIKPQVINLMSGVSRHVTGEYKCHVYSILSKPLIKQQVIHLMSDVCTHVTGVYISRANYFF